MSGGWELVARWPGGTVSVLASVPGSGVTLAATAAGLHTSSDGGRRWQWSGLGPAPVTEAIAVSGRFGDDRTVLLGTARGVHRSTDGGTSWRQVLAGSRTQCLSATPDFVDGGVVLAGTESDGILRSEDGGRDWSGANAGLLDLNVTALALSPRFERDRTAFAGTVSGLYRSRNGGRAWRLVELGPESATVQAIAVSPTFEDDGLVLAGTESDGLFRSDDGGQFWEMATGFLERCVTCLAFGRAGSGLIVAGTAAGLAVSHDGGQSWTLEAPELGPILSVAIEQDGTILAGAVSEGVARREPGAGSWAAANQGLAGRATVDLALTTAYGAVPLIAVASLDAGVFLSHDGGVSWKTGQTGLAGLAASSVALVQPAAGEGALLAAFDGGLYTSTDIQDGWQRVEIDGLQGGRVTTLTPIGGSANASAGVMAAGRGCLLLSQDGGALWQEVPLPVRDADIVNVAASAEMARDRTLYAVTRAARVAADGSVGPDGLELWQTQDLGAHWHRWLHAPTATVMSLAVPPRGALDAAMLVGYAGRVARPMRSAQEVRRGERRPLWQEARIGSLSSSVTAVAISPHVERDRTVLAAADNGVYLSQDGGASFAAWDQELDVPLVTALSLAARADGGLDAYALGLGGTLWRRRVT